MCYRTRDVSNPHLTCTDLNDQSDIEQTGRRYDRHDCASRHVSSKSWTSDKCTIKISRRSVLECLTKAKIMSHTSDPRLSFLVRIFVRMIYSRHIGEDACKYSIVFFSIEIILKDDTMILKLLMCFVVVMSILDYLISSFIVYSKSALTTVIWIIVRDKHVKTIQFCICKTRSVQTLRSDDSGYLSRVQGKLIFSQASEFSNSCWTSTSFNVESWGTRWQICGLDVPRFDVQSLRISVFPSLRRRSLLNQCRVRWRAGKKKE